MLVTFKSKAAAEVIMYQDHAKPILDLLGKDVSQGVITVPELDNAIATVEAEIAAFRQRQAAEKAKREAEQASEDKDREDGENEPAAIQDVSFPTRAYPLLEMLRAAQKHKQPVAWGI
jgi:hypothetical protein